MVSVFAEQMAVVATPNMCSACAEIEAFPRFQKLLMKFVRRLATMLGRTQLSPIEMTIEKAMWTTNAYRHHHAAASPPF